MSSFWNNEQTNLLNAILTDIRIVLNILRKPVSKATRIALELPSITRKGIHMPNFELPSDEVATVTIKTTNSAGIVEPMPAGDVFTATSSAPASLGVTVGKDAAGAPAIVLTPLVQVSPNITITVSDSAGLAQAVQIVDVVLDVNPKNIILDVPGAVLTPQPTPTATGP
jgi:hypothetical protein